ncbi:MAG: hypothetical protein ACRC46_12805 [Thermoguttaceae bacterium]
MITEIIEPQSDTYVLHLPQEYVKKRVEVSISLAADKPPRRLRQMPPHLRNRGKILGDIISPIVPPEDWDCVTKGTLRVISTRNDEK